MHVPPIIVTGAREHNLRDVTVGLPRGRLVCLSGVSGSGKSSLAFDTLYAEGQRRYVESLSTFARQFLGQLPRPDVDSVTGLSPAISIAQKSAGTNPRSTVATMTEIHDFLRVLYARVGTAHCPTCDAVLEAQPRDQIVERIIAARAGRPVMVLAPVVREAKGEHRDLFTDLVRQGFTRARVDGSVCRVEEPPALEKQLKHTIDVVVDRLIPSEDTRSRLAEAVELALRTGGGQVIVAAEPARDGGQAGRRPGDGASAGTSDAAAPSPRPAPGSRGGDEGDLVLSSRYACTTCGVSYDTPEPQLFSFNSPQGACPACDGLGDIYGIDPEKLVTEPAKTLRKGAIGVLGTFRDMPRWLRRLLTGVAAHAEAKKKLPPGTLLDTPWQELTAAQKRIWLDGTGMEEIQLAWRRGRAERGAKTKFEGLRALLANRWRNAKSGIVRRMLEKLMSVTPCHVCQGARLSPQARAVRITSRGQGWGRGTRTPALSPREREKGTTAPLPREESRGPCDATASHAPSPRPSPKGRGRKPVAPLPALSPGNPDQNRELSLDALCALPIADARAFLADLALDGTQRVIAVELMKEINGRLAFLDQVGLGYLALDRKAPTLSGGESQRIRLAAQIGSGLSGVLYVLDEPSIGLHPRDNVKLLGALEALRDKGNTVVVVEHDEDTIRAADWVVDFGPGPGKRGGEVVAAGTPDDVARSPRSVTGAFLAGRDGIPVPKQRRQPRGSSLVLKGVRHNNLRNVDVEIPLGLLVCVTGVSGSGKSSLVGDVLEPELRRRLGSEAANPGAFDALHGADALDKVIVIDQSPIGRTPRSNPATYVKVWDDIRALFTMLPEAKKRGWKAGRFSFNVAGGRCEACEGNGSVRLDMDFLADVWMTCEVCGGARFAKDTLEVRWKGKNVAELLTMEIGEALDLFADAPDIARKLQTLHDVGLDYLHLGQPSPTLSGGEAQRVKLSRELAKRSTGKTLYILDEPTTGLHMADVRQLLTVLERLVDAGNTVLVVEHNLDVVKRADWVIDLGPEGGAGGGRIVATGTPEQVAKVKASHTARALGPILAAGRTASRPARKPAVRRKAAADPAAAVQQMLATVTKSSRDPGPPAITIRGAALHNLKHVDLDVPRGALTVCCGPSGSGKTSLAFDTLYAEGQRRYVESLSPYARQFVGQVPKPLFEKIEGLAPAVAIEQRGGTGTPRSTVGTLTEMYDHFRVLAARLGTMHCPGCGTPVGAQSVDQTVERLFEHGAGARLLLLAPTELKVGQTPEALFAALQAAGHVRVRIDGRTVRLDDKPVVDRKRKSRLEIVIDRVTVSPADRSRLAQSVEAAFAAGNGTMLVARAVDGADEPDWPVEVHSRRLACPTCGRGFKPLEPRQFSFNSPLGWCPSCDGLGTRTGVDRKALVRDSALSLGDGALDLWPTLQGPAGRQMGRLMLEALCRVTGLPLDVPLADLSGLQLRVLFEGTGEKWIDVPLPSGGPPTGRHPHPGPLPEGEGEGKSLLAQTSEIPSPRRQTKGKPPISSPLPLGEGGRRPGEGASSPVWFSFQFQGLEAACEEAARLVAALRGKVDAVMDEVPCSECGGSRLADVAAAVTLWGRPLDVWCRMPLGRLQRELAAVELAADEKRIAGDLLRELNARVAFLVDVGLEYLDLARPAGSLSGGELQRIRLAAQVGSGLTGVLYVLDEPTIGLHPRDTHRLVAALGKLRDLGNTVVVVEHDRDVVAAADEAVDFGPGSGREGGTIVAHGPPAKLAEMKTSVTGPYLADKRACDAVLARKLERGRRVPAGWIEVRGITHRTLRGVDARFPLGVLAAVTGPSGSGKTSLVLEVLWRAAARRLHAAREQPGRHAAVKGLEAIDRVILVDQEAIGLTPGSTPATYTGVFDHIRQLYAKVPEARTRGFAPRTFSFNVAGGRCEACEGLGQRRVEMHFLPDVWVECEACKGRRYSAETLHAKWHGKSIADVLEMSVADAAAFFAPVPPIARILATLVDVGLGYVTLGQPAPQLSGGEAQRVKLSRELAKPGTGSTLYILDEPTTGLHFADIEKLLHVLERLVDAGNTVLVIEHNLEVIQAADWVLDMGPEAGAGGGRIVTEGPPEDLVIHARRWRQQADRDGAGDLLRSHTGEALEAFTAAPPTSPAAPAPASRRARARSRPG
jgi:excinuclease ABC subunit A